MFFFIIGDVGDCWLLAAVSVLAEDASNITNIFNSPDISLTGKYTLKLYLDGKYSEVVIDDKLPVNENDRLIYSKVIHINFFIYRCYLVISFQRM